MKDVTCSKTLYQRVVNELVMPLYRSLVSLRQRVDLCRSMSNINVQRVTLCDFKYNFINVTLVK